MGTTLIPAVIAFLAAAWAARLIYQVLPVPAAVDIEALARVTDYQTEVPKTLPFWRAILLPFNRLAARLPPTLVGRTEVQLYWAQFQGQWIGWSSVEWWGMRIGVTLAGLVAGTVLTADPLLALVIPVLLYVYAGIKLNTPYERATRQVQRELPEVAQTLSLLIGTNKGYEESLQIVSQGQGLVNRWIRYVLATRPLDKPMFSDLRGTAGKGEGHLLLAAKRSGAPTLVNFATQFDFLTSAGTEERMLMSTVAETVASDYETEVMARAEALGNKLLIPMVLFFFIPYMVALTLPIFVTAGK